MLASEFGMAATDGMAIRVQVSRLIDVWHAARERNAARNAEATAARIEGRHREIPPQTFVSVRRQYQQSHGKLEDKGSFSKEFIQNKVVKIGEGELKAKSLHGGSKR